MGPEAGKPIRRSATSDRIPETMGQQGVSGRNEPPKSATATAAKVLLPALKELASGLGTQHELVKEMVAAVQVCRTVAPYVHSPGYVFCVWDGDMYQHTLHMCNVLLPWMCVQRHPDFRAQAYPVRECS